jgi:uncharacterized iron-regulated membrane protein
MRGNRYRLRAFWLQVHLWLGLTLGVLGTLIGITGSILVFDHNVDALLNPRRFAVSGPEVVLPFSQYLGNAAQALGDKARPFLLRLPEEPGMPVTVLARGEGDGYRVYLDPPTGRVLETATGDSFVGWIHNFHEYLTLREYHGRDVVGAVGIAMLISSLSGLYLWWPARGRFRKALRFRPGLPKTRNVHYMSGFYGFIVLAMLSFTGIFLAYPEAGRAVVAALTLVSPPVRNVQAPEAEATGKALTVDEAVSVAQALYPAEKVWNIALPAGPRGTYRINLSESGVPNAQPARGTILFIDPASGSVLRKMDAATRTGGDTFLVMQRAMHAGKPFGFIGRCIICLAGLLPSLFVVTGTVMWLRRRRRRLAASATKNAAA